MLFTDSDIIPDRELVKHHVESHRRNPQNHRSRSRLRHVAAGNESDSLHALVRRRWRSFLRPIAPKCEIDFHFFYSCN